MVEAPFQAAARKVVHERASDARQVNAIVLVESNILGINGGMLDVVGNFVRLNGVALFQLEFRKRGRSISRIHHRFLRMARKGGVIDAGQIFGPAVHNA